MKAIAKSGKATVSKNHLFKSSSYAYRYGRKGKPETMLHNVSQDTLAEMIGTMLSRANFSMKKFKKLGLIGHNRGLHVNPSLLRVVLHD